MTLRECAIIMAHTGICMLQGDNLKYFYDYVGELIGKPVYTHDIANNADAIKTESKEDFLKLCESAEKSDKYRWHDLRKDKDDLPMTDDMVLIEYYSLGTQQNENAVAWHDRQDNTFQDGMFLYMSVIAWRYIKPFEEVSKWQI